jgi:hypothetical protein
VWGAELYFDSTKVQTNASIKGMLSHTEFKADRHLKELFPSTQDTGSSFGKLVEKFDGKRITGTRKPVYRRVADEKISPTDPDATPMPPSGGGSAVLGYRNHYVVDGGKDRIILSALVTPASIMDNTPMLDLTNLFCTRWGIQPEIAVGDAKYGTEQNMVGLEDAGIKAFLPIPDLSKRRNFYPSDDFQYDTEKDHYICPQGHILPLLSRRKTEEKYVYRSDAKVCNACPVKGECTNSKSGRYIFRSFHQKYIERVKAHHQTEKYQKAMRKRGYWVEPLFGEAKDFHRLRRFRLRGLLKVNIEGVLIAAGQNLKRLLKYRMEEFCCFLRDVFGVFDGSFTRLFQQAEMLCEYLVPG